MLPNSARELIEYQGWAAFPLAGEGDLQSAVDAVRQVGECLGPLVPPSVRAPLVQVLTPIGANQAKRNSLSASFALGAFPYHMDTSHWTIPSRYIVFLCANAGGGEQIGRAHV